MRIYNKKSVISKRRGLRKKQTDAETKLWWKLRANQLGVKFFRQYSIGEYICDFYCPVAKLVIEVDGGGHYTDEGKQYDDLRSAEMSGLGIKVIRFSNIDVLKNVNGVMEVIQKQLPRHPRESP